MRILGIDPGLNITGFGLIENDGSSTTVIIKGVIKTSSKQQTQDRLNKIYAGVLKIILKHKPEVLVLEKIYSHYKYPMTSVTLGHARGAVCLACSQANIPLRDYSAKRIKKVITGKGNASKHQVQMMIQHLLNLDKIPESYDISDALALALGHMYVVKKEVIGYDFKD